MAQKIASPAYIDKLPIYMQGRNSGEFVLILNRKQQSDFFEGFKNEMHFRPNLHIFDIVTGKQLI